LPDWKRISQHIADVTGEPFAPDPPSSVPGGCINRAVRLGDAHRKFFVKLNEATSLDMFAAEAAGLAELAAARALRVPAPLCWGTSGSATYLVLENLDLGPVNRTTAERLGRALAELHRRSALQFGWHRDNTIGSTPQINTACGDWALFWRDHRLGYQLALAARQGHGGGLQRSGAELLVSVEALLADHHPPPSLLHGDLWSGNAASDREGNPVIFDPAVYYGDREADLAMAELFGGFGERFYAAYRESWPLDPGYAVRKTLYNLYHILNHLNLFGGGYRAQAQHMIESLLAETR
jgi:protein-ribulosamine 3-kinase